MDATQVILGFRGVFNTSLFGVRPALNAVPKDSVVLVNGNRINSINHAKFYSIINKENLEFLKKINIASAMGLCDVTWKSPYNNALYEFSTIDENGVETDLDLSFIRSHPVDHNAHAQYKFALESRKYNTTIALISKVNIHQVEKYFEEDYLNPNGYVFPDDRRIVTIINEDHSNSIGLEHRESFWQALK